MSSKYEDFWNYNSYALIGHSAIRSFPTLTLEGLLSNDKSVFPVDPLIDQINGKRTFPDLASLPETVEAAVIEVPKSETYQVVSDVISAGIKNIWIHMNTDTPEAVAAAKNAEINLCYGTCAVMYLKRSGLHKFHGWINKLFKKY